MQPACVMAPQAEVSGQAEASFEDRWAAWVARGAEQDRKTKKRVVAAATVMAGGLALWLALALALA